MLSFHLVTERILIVEDEAVLCKHLARLFVREGYEVVTAGTRTEALAALSHGQFETLLLDVQLPDGDGLELLAAVRERPWPPRTVVMTAFSTFDNPAWAERANVVRVLRKPLDLCELITAVRNHAAPRSY